MNDAGIGFDQDCPITGQPHRYFVFKTFETYELFTPTVAWIEKHAEAMLELYDGNDQLYRKVEVAILGCNCSSVIRQEIKKV